LQRAPNWLAKRRGAAHETSRVSVWTTAPSWTISTSKRRWGLLLALTLQLGGASV
jgi:hypothetical protein